MTAREQVKSTAFWFAAAALAAGFASPACAQDQDSGSWDARIIASSGDVQIFAAEDPQNGLPAQAGLPLSDGDRVKTGDDSSATIALSGESLIRLDADTDFTLAATVRSNTRFSLTVGSFLGKVRSLLEGEQLQVETPAAVAAVRGTEFGVNAGASGGTTDVGVFDEGKVEVTGVSGQSQIVTPNQETSVAKGAAPERPHELRRFMAYRRFMRAMVRRLPIIRRQWRPLSATQRQRRRQDMRARMRARRNMKREARQGGRTARVQMRREKRQKAQAPKKTPAQQKKQKRKKRK